MIPIVLYVLVVEYRRLTDKYALEKKIIETNYSTFFGDPVAQSYNLEEAAEIEIAKSTKSLATSDKYFEVSSELLKYTVLLNPVRLGVIKILSTHTQYQQSEVRKHLGVSWGKFTSHINALEKAGFVSTSETFVDAKPMKMLYLEELGRIRFRELGLILKSIIQSE